MHHDAGCMHVHHVCVCYMDASGRGCVGAEAGSAWAACETPAESASVRHRWSSESSSTFSQANRATLIRSQIFVIDLIGNLIGKSYETFMLCFAEHMLASICINIVTL